MYLWVTLDYCRVSQSPVWIGVGLGYVSVDERQTVGYMRIQRCRIQPDLLERTTMEENAGIGLEPLPDHPPE